MPDQNTSLPVRSEADGADERVHVKIVDGLVPSQMATVDVDKNVHVEIHGNDPAAVDRVVRTSEQGALTPDGVYHAANNSKPGNSGLIASSRNATPSDSTQTERITSITNSTKKCLDIALQDENGAAYTTLNPLPVTFVDSEGTEVNDYQADAGVAALSSANNDYTAVGTFVLTGWACSGSGKIKGELKIETGVATGVYTNRFVEFNSTANPNIYHDLREPIRVSAGVKVRLSVTNRDNQSQDLYSTIVGHEE